jgi:Uma2 family endonuclease
MREFVMSSLAQRLVGWEEFLRLPERSETGERYELRDGEVVLAAAPRPIHIKTEKRIERLLEALAGELFVVTTEFPYRPLPNFQYWFADVACVARTDWDAMPDEDYPVMTPALIVEVLSPSNTSAKLSKQRIVAMSAGTREFWVVDTAERTVYVTNLEGWKTYGMGGVIPFGLGSGQISVAEIFTLVDPEVVEVGYGIADGAEADLAEAGVGVVPALQDAAMVEVDLEAGAAEGDFQDAPVVGGNFVAGHGDERDALAVLYFVDGNGLLDGTGTGEVVVIFVTITPDDAAAFDVVSGNGFDAHADFAVAEGHGFQDGDGETIGAGISRELRENVGLGGRGAVASDFPLGGAAATRDGCPLGRSFAQRTSVEIDDPSGGRNDPEQDQPGRFHKPRRGLIWRTTFITLITVLTYRPLEGKYAAAMC